MLLESPSCQPPSPLRSPLVYNEGVISIRRPAGFFAISRLRFAHIAGALGVFTLGSLFLPSPALSAPAAIPMPPRGEAVATVLSLIRFKHSSCDRIAGKILEHWEHYEGSDEEKEEKARDYILKSELSDLAASRAAADIVVKLLPRVKMEVNSETHGSMARLDTVVTSLCDLVAFPTGPLASFRQHLAEVLNRFEREETELGRLVVIPSSATLEASIEPYLGKIQLAGLSAEAEYQQYLESLRPKRRKATFSEQVQEWHRQVYTPATAPTKLALGKYLAAREKQDSQATSLACRELSAQLITLMRDTSVFKGPDANLEDPLRLAYAELRGLATNCINGNSREVDRRWSQFNARLQRLSTDLGRYGVQP